MRKDLHGLAVALLIIFPMQLYATGRMECEPVDKADPDGERVEACFHPATGEKMLVARRGNILFRADSVEEK